MPAEKLLNPRGLRRYPSAALFALAAVIFISILGGNCRGRMGGDFPAFYAAGRIVLDTARKKLYRLEDEAAVQKECAGEGRTIPFPYPPFAALAYYPLSLLDYRLSYRLHTLLMALALALAVRLLAHKTARFRAGYDLALGAALLYYPMLIATLAGQNTPITLLLYVAAWRAGSTGKERTAGLFLGLMLFKPQFAIPMIGLHALSGRYRTVATSIVVALGLYLTGVFAYGPSWLTDWLRYASWVSGLAARLAPNNSVCWLGFLQSLLGVDSLAALVIGRAAALGTAAAISFIWYRDRKDPDLSARFGLAPAALMLMSPHAVYYDMGLLLFTYAICMARKEATLKLVGLMWILAPLEFADAALGFSPLFFLLLLSGLMAVCVLTPGALKGRICPAKRLPEA